MARVDREDVLADADTLLPSPAADEPSTRVDSPVEPLVAGAEVEPTGSDLERSTGVAVSEPTREDETIAWALGRYLVLGTLGKGGMGTVYKAFDRSLDRQVAVKVLRYGVGDHHTQRLVREAQALAQLSHPNVVQVYEVGEVHGQAFVAMELVSGRTLRAWIEDERPHWRRRVEVYLQAGEGLAAAHARGLVHRDFKPSNAMIDDEGRVRVLDFGLARGMADAGTESDPGSREGSELRAEGPGVDAQLTETGFVMGTPAYMPLEQMRGDAVDARSDQFSFCVALFEALFGARPFPGRKVAELMESIRKGAIVPPPRDSIVPYRVRQALLRGLAAEPRDRWPAMGSLLDALRRACAPRGRRWLALGAGGALVLVGSVLGYRAGADGGALCSGAAGQLEGVWDEGRRPRVREAILATELPYAADTWDRVAHGLDDYAAAWARAHTQACEATRMTREQTEEVMELRMGCLAERRVALRATVDVLARADASAVQRAVSMVTTLPGLSRCEDVATLRQAFPPPDDPEAAAEVGALRETLADADAMRSAGQYQSGLDLVDATMARVEALDHPPLEIEAKVVRGNLRAANGRYAEAEEDLRDAYRRAVEVGHDVEAGKAATSLTFVVGVRRAHHAEGLVWAESSMPLARRLGDPADIGGSMMNAGVVLAALGRHEEAEGYYRRALESWETTYGTDHLLVAKGVNNLGNLLRNQGEYEQAEELYRRGLEIREAALGPAHPDVASSLGNLGMVRADRGEPGESEGYYRRALEISSSALGPEHPKLAATLQGLGLAVHEQGRYEEAELHHRRALEIREEALGPEHVSLAGSHLNLGRALESQGRLEAAKEHYEGALRIWEAGLGPTHAHVSIALTNLGSVARAQGRIEDARRHYERAIEVREHAHGDRHPQLVVSLLGLGAVLRDDGRLDAATRPLERALRLGQQTYGDAHPALAPPLLELAEVALAAGHADEAQRYAERARAMDASPSASSTRAWADFVLARALWAQPSQRARARKLAEAARDEWAELGSREDDERAKVEAWLVERR